MSLYIGKQQESSEIMYISVSWVTLYGTVATKLKNFYPTQQRVDALLELGNLVCLGSTPYGKYNWDEGFDCIHCRAEIRDDKEKKGKHLPRYSSETEFLKLEGHLFLYKEGCWHYRFDGVLSATLPEILPDLSNKPLKGLEFYKLDEKGDLSYSYGKDFKCWNDIIVKSNEEQAPIFIFRGGKLITSVNHPLNQ